MPAPYSPDLRKKVLHAYEVGAASLSETARLLDVGPASIGRWRRLKRETGTLDAKKPTEYPGRRALDGAGEARLAELVRKEPDATGEELAAKMFDEYGVEISKATVNRVLRRLGLSRKKRRSSPRSGSRRGSNR